MRVPHSSCLDSPVLGEPLISTWKKGYDITHTHNHMMQKGDAHLRLEDSDEKSCDDDDAARYHGDSDDDDDEEEEDDVDGDAND